jgi:signal peptidase II
MRPRVLGLVAAAVVFFADQASKVWMLDVFGIEGRGAIALTPFLDIVMAWNRGVSYGLFQFPPLVLLAFSLCVSLALAVWMWRSGARVTSLALGLVIGGALGNALDRWRFGAVADFFHFHTPFWAGPLSNYVFNVADVGIVAGAALLLYEAFLEKPRGEPAASA